MWAFTFGSSGELAVPGTRQLILRMLLLKSPRAVLIRALPTHTRLMNPLPVPSLPEGSRCASGRECGLFDSGFDNNKNVHIGEGSGFTYAPTT